MSSSKKIYIFIGVVLGLFLLLQKMKIKYFSKNPNALLRTESLSENVKISKPSKLIEQPRQSQPEVMPTPTPPSLTIPARKEHLDVAYASSLKERENFEKIALMKVKWPEDFLFSSQEIDEGMAGIVGRKPNSSQIYGLLARKGLSTNGEVEKFLPELAQRISGVSPQLVSGKISPEKYDVSPDSPFQNVYTWQVQNEKNVLYLIKADRKDGLGSYMIFLTGSKKETQMTERGLENLVSDVQITSPEKPSR